MQDLFHNSTMWLRDTGILNKLKYRAMEPDIYQPAPKIQPNNQPLVLTELSLAMFLEMGGIALAVIAFILELRCSARCARKNEIQVVNG